MYWPVKCKTRHETLFSGSLLVDDSNDQQLPLLFSAKYGTPRVVYLIYDQRLKCAMYNKATHTHEWTTLKWKSCMKNVFIACVKLDCYFLSCMQARKFDCIIHVRQYEDTGVIYHKKSCIFSHIWWSVQLVNPSQAHRLWPVGYSL